MKYVAITSLEKIKGFISDFFELEIAKRTSIEIKPDGRHSMEIVIQPFDHDDGVRLDSLFQHGDLFQRGWNLVFTKSYN